MNKKSWCRSWARYFLWTHVAGVVGFYLTVWWRTRSNDADRAIPLPAKTTTTPTIGPLVSIILPVRNEEKNVRRCVNSLLEQDYGHFELIVVDDGSDDATGAILDELAAGHPHGDQMYVLRLRDLPAGWAGKPHAIHQGVQEARGEWLLFTDADTWHAPNALRSAMKQATHEKTDLFSMASVQELPDFWRRVLMPMAYLGISMQYPSRQVNDPRSPVAVANGQYILLRHDVYDQIGGYARSDLRSTLLDDRDLARVIKENGFRLHFVDGSGLVHVHMYHGLRETWRGWRKNAYLGSRGGIPFTLVELLGLPMISITPFLLPLFYPWVQRRYDAGGPVEFGAATMVEMAALFSYRRWLDAQLNVPWYYSFTHPLGGAIFEGILLQSMLRVLTRRGVDWRGRVYHGRQEAEEVS